MQVVFDVLTALLAGAGALAVGWVLFGRLISPVGSQRSGAVFAVIRAEGGGVGLEQAVTGLLWLNHSGLSAFQIVIADAGLNDTGRAVAVSLAGQKEQVFLCPLALLEEQIGAARG